MVTQNVERRAYSPREVAAAIGINEATVRKEIRAKRLHARRVGRILRVSEEALTKYLEGSSLARGARG